ncbi:MAG: YihY/virulence factor BrkB family protein [Halioglobus sp.]
MRTEDNVERDRSALQRLSGAFSIFFKAVKGLFTDNCLRNAAALSFYALFSIAPIIYIAVYVAGVLAADINFQQQITQQFADLLGERAAEGISVLLSTLDNQNQGTFQLAVGIAILVFSATNIFVQIQSTFNDIYRVQPRASAGLIKQVLDRVISLGIILSLGFLLIISLVLDSLVLAFHDYLFELLNDAALVVVQLLQMLVLVFLITSVIYGMFHFLPDVYLPDTLKVRGSLLIAGMLLLGKYGIGLYIANSKLSELGGASASIFVLMLWIYYTSIILFFGAEVIRAMAERDNLFLEPRRYATRIRTVVIGDTGTDQSAGAETPGTIGNASGTEIISDSQATPSGSASEQAGVDRA